MSVCMFLESHQLYYFNPLVGEKLKVDELYEPSDTNHPSG